MPKYRLVIEVEAENAEEAREFIEEDARSLVPELVKEDDLRITLDRSALSEGEAAIAIIRGSKPDDGFMWQVTTTDRVRAAEDAFWRR